MAEHFDLILKGGTVVNHQGVRVSDIGARAGRITAIGDLTSAVASKTIDCTGLHVLPGVIDSQVHFREPGLEHKENLESGSLAAVLGGVTCVFEMPNTRPPTTSATALSDKVRRATGRMHCDFAFWIGGTRENVHELTELERLPGVAGIKLFMGSSTGDLLVEDDDSILAILRQTHRRVAVHSEDEFRLRERLGHRRSGEPASHPEWRDETVALRSTQRLVALARQANALIHVLHVSTAEEIQFLADHKDVATCEATPHHLTLSVDDYPRLGSLMQMNPPVRSSSHQEAIWKGIQQSVIDVLGSDHAPHTRSEKQQPYPASPSGMTGVQTLVPIMLDHINAGRLTLEQFVDLTSHGPQRIFGISKKGRISAGYDADFTIVDMARRQVIRDSDQASRAGWTPYDGKEVVGWPIGTIIRGRLVMWEGKTLATASGQPVDFR